MKRGLFINNKKAKDSIYESGYMVYKSLLNSEYYSLDYQEVDINDREIKTGYDFYFFNYHPYTMSWLQTRSLKTNLGFVITMILEVAPGDAFVMCPEKDFNLYCALDPTIKSSQQNLISFPRPLEKIDFDLPSVENNIPVIGSFGFATNGKGFQHVVDAVNKEFDKAVVRINIPFGDFVPESKEYAAYLGRLCIQKAKPGIDVKISHDFMTKEELIKWCNANSLNCFLYDRDMPGLSATTDQAIITGKPLAVSKNDTFRHITAYLSPYPDTSLKDSIKNSTPIVKQMRQDWEPKKFREKFEATISGFETRMSNTHPFSETIMLPVKTKNIRDFVTHRAKKYRRKLNSFRLNKFFTAKSKNEII